MKEWKCNFCNKYISIDFDDVNVGDSIDFEIYKDKFYSSYITGCVLFLEFDYVYIVCDLGFYRINKYQAYPTDAPVAFIYNMFGVCTCRNRF